MGSLGEKQEGLFDFYYTVLKGKTFLEKKQFLVFIINVNASPIQIILGQREVRGSLSNSIYNGLKLFEEVDAVFAVRQQL